MLFSVVFIGVQFEYLVDTVTITITITVLLLLMVMVLILSIAEVLIEWHVFLTHLTWTNRYNSTGLIDAHLFTHEINKREATPEHTSTQRTETAPPFKLVFICWVRARKRVYRSLFLFRMCVYVCLRIVPFGLSSFIFSSIEILFVSFGCCCCLFEFWVAHHTFWAHWNENERVKRVVHICVPEGTCTHIGIQF